MLQYNFTKRKKETLQNWSAFRLSVVKPKLYIESQWELKTNQTT